jgi:hypothetical protein
MAPRCRRVGAVHSIKPGRTPRFERVSACPPKAALGQLASDHQLMTADEHYAASQVLDRFYRWGEALVVVREKLLPELSGPEPFAAILFARMPLALSRMMS